MLEELKKYLIVRGIKAETGINARFLEVKTGNIVWIGSYTYESFKIETALEWTITGLLKQFKKK